MEFKSGKHAGKTTEEVLISITEKCQGECGSIATRATAYRGTHGLIFW